MHQKVDSLIELLKDGKWHTTQELSLRTNISESSIQKITDFLADYSLIEFCRSNKRRIRARFMFTDFLKKLG